MRRGWRGRKRGAGAEVVAFVEKRHLLLAGSDEPLRARNCDERAKLKQS
jgi:hypothetical protein